RCSRAFGHHARGDRDRPERLRAPRRRHRLLTRPSSTSTSLTKGVLMSTPIPVGPATITGTGISLTAFVLAVLAALTAHGHSQTLDIVASGTVGLVTALAVLLGRFSQAKALINAPTPPPAP